MKRIIVVLLVSSLLCFSFCSCEESTEDKAERLRKTAEQLGNQVSEQQQRIDDFQIHKRKQSKVLRKEK